MLLGLSSLWATLLRFHKSTGFSLHRTQPADKSALAKTAPSDNYPSARPPRLILIDAVLTQIVAL
jgi:hypothetical protein